MVFKEHQNSLEIEKICHFSAMFDFVFDKFFLDNDDRTIYKIEISYTHFL
jgi:hypothetical protein